MYRIQFIYWIRIIWSSRTTLNSSVQSAFITTILNSPPVVANNAATTRASISDVNIKFFIFEGEKIILLRVMAISDVHVRSDPSHILPPRIFSPCCQHRLFAGRSPCSKWPTHFFFRLFARTHLVGCGPPMSRIGMSWSSNSSRNSVSFCQVKW